MKYLVILALLALAGCVKAEKPVEPAWGYDQCARRVLFQQCLQSLPAGPVQAKYNDWEEVVEACEDAARRQSYLDDKRVIKKECQG